MITIKNKDDYDQLKSWPFLEAKRILEKHGGFNNFKKPKKDFIVFETGYGPSGLPHIGTFGEVVRTSMVRNAFMTLTDCETKIITFSDDMDGLRKVPENVPKKSMLEKYIDVPLTSIPDPFDKFKSFGEHNNYKLRSFLDSFNFSYEFKSSTELYNAGEFDETIKLIMQNYEKILEIILPTLRDARKENYSPFLPICNKTKKVLQVKIQEYRKNSNSIIYIDPNSNKLIETSIFGGNCKLQWKVDWAMRWVALGVDYEMCGKDLTDSVTLGNKICNSLNKTHPLNYIYEMFLDDKGEKISKSKGNGISVDEWLRYASPESLALFMFQKPQSAKKLYFNVIPKSIDEYSKFIDSFHNEKTLKKIDNPVWHIHSGNPPKVDNNIMFNTLLNLVSVCNTSDSKIIWKYLKAYDENLEIDKNVYLDRLVNYSINYYKDFILLNKKYKLVDEKTKPIFIDLKNILLKLPRNSSAVEIQEKIYEVGKNHTFDNLKDFFHLIYQVLLGQDQGPRLGSFIKLYGIEKTIILIEKAIKKEDLIVNHD